MKNPLTRVKTTSIKESTKQRTASILFLILICAAAGFGGGYIAVNRNQTSNNSGSSTISKQDQRAAINESQLVNAIAKNVGPSVVSVNVTSQAQQSFDFFGYSTGGGTQESAGTGIIISDDGYILTNRHVVPAGSTSVSVTLSDGTELGGVEVIGRTGDSDPLDIAFLKIKDTKGHKLTKASIGDSSKVQVGDRVVAIGNALGQFQNTVTSGIISGYGRSVEAGDASGAGSTETLQNLFQTDAAINAGNSGGPLVNINGQVIGVNTAVAGSGAQNIGFAIPINDVKGLVTSVLNKGKLERPYLGVRYVTLTDDYAYQYNLSTKRGAYIVPGKSGSVSISKGSPAEKAGLKEKDIITKIDGVAIDGNNSLTSLIGQKTVGDEVTLTVVRDGKEQTIKIKLEAAPTS